MILSIYKNKKIWNPFDWENFISSIYRNARDFSDSILGSSFSLHNIQYQEQTDRTISALKELNGLPLTWMRIKINRQFSRSSFQDVREERQFLNELISFINTLLQFRCDFERYFCLIQISELFYMSCKWLFKLKLGFLIIFEKSVSPKIFVIEKLLYF